MRPKKAYLSPVGIRSVGAGHLGGFDGSSGGSSDARDQCEDLGFGRQEINGLWTITTTFSLIVLPLVHQSETSLSAQF
ncbi:hypothetical protein CesoFtcFv8_013408 [Champsocephalus esox]|nr:hypothetical protein CesoFtcFv8_013408 [Champsocephalus esox]